MLPARAAGFLAGALIIFVALFSAAAGYLGLRDVAQGFFTLSGATIASALALCLFDFATRAVRWRMFCRDSGIRLPFGRTLLYYFAGYSMSLTPGRLGELVRLWFLKRSHGYRLQRSGVLYIADRAADANAYVWLVICAAAAFPGYGRLAATAVLAVLAGTLLLYRPLPLLWAVGRIYRWTGFRPRLFAWASILLKRAAPLFRPKIYLRTVAVGAVGYLAVAFALDLILAELDSPIGLARATFVLALALLAGGLSMMPGGLGGTDATMFALLVYSGVPASAALVATACLRIAHLWFAVAIGLVTLPMALRTSTSVPDPAAPG